MGEGSDAGSGMQFDQVEAPGASGPPACGQCHRPLDEYFALGGHMFCRTCVDAFKNGGSFWRPLLFGTGAAVVGATGAMIFHARRGETWAFIAIIVGILVGYAVRKGARGRGGWKFQALAMALTYVSITTGYIPFVVKAFRNVEAKKKDTAAVEPGGVTAEGVHELAPVPADASASKPAGGAVIVAFLFLFGVALAMPFLGMINFMGWLFIAIALYEAWRLNRRVPITGPFRFGGALSVPAPAPVTPGMPPAAGP